MRRRPSSRHLTAISLALAVSSVGLTACTLPNATSLAADVADPDVTWDGSRYVLHATNTAHGNVPTWTSPDLSTWAFAGDALPTLPKWAEPGWTWAPSSIRRSDGKWFLYFSAAVRGRRTANGQPLKCIGVASGPGAAGPFRVVPERDAAPLLCQPSIGGDIDPSTFRDATGPATLVTKVDGNSMARPTKLESRRLAWNLWSFAPDRKPTTALASTIGTWEQQVVEGPDLVRLGGRLHLLYSGGDFAKTTYGEGQASCATPTATCVRSGRLLNDPSFGSGAGGASAFSSRTGGGVLAWHAYTTPDSTKRSLLLGTLASTPAGPLTVGGSPVPAAAGTSRTPAQRASAPAQAQLTVPNGQPITVPNAHTR